MGKNNSVQNIMGEAATNALNVATSNSVCGTPFLQDGFTFIPINQVSASYAAGGSDILAGKQGSGANVKLTPISFLVLKDGKAKTISIKAENSNAAALAELLIDTAKEIFKKQKQID